MAKIMRIWNRNTEQPPPEAIYVGRYTKWGNPYHVSRHTKASHQIAVDWFRMYAIKRLEKEPDWLEPLQGKDLVCWCTPLPCHAQVLMELANKS